jgi:predicted nucleic acid-binding protein
VVAPGPTTEMVDANVLSYGVIGGPDDKDLQRRECHFASRALIERLASVRVSAIAWAEFKRILRPAEVQRADALLKSTYIEKVDAAVVDAATKLLNDYRRVEKVCPTCYGSEESSPCKTCKRMLSRQQRLNDSFILATAVVLPDVATLYTYDQGIKELAKHTGGCDVKQPPNPSGPLFQRKENW